MLIIWTPIIHVIYIFFVFSTFSIVLSSLKYANVTSVFYELIYELNSVYFPAMMGYMRELVTTNIIHPEAIFNNLNKSNNIMNFSNALLGLSVPVFRLILSIIFAGSFLLRPLVMRPLNLVWRRIVESDKPVFTLTFGGAAAFASAISEAAKHL
jgi:hypothetical protein